jgi:hypothetical protein
VQIERAYLNGKLKGITLWVGELACKRMRKRDRDEEIENVEGVDGNGGPKSSKSSER